MRSQKLPRRHGYRLHDAPTETDRRYSARVIDGSGPGGPILEALRRRGFLFDEEHGMAAISDNSHSEDASSLVGLLLECGLDHLVGLANHGVPLHWMDYRTPDDPTGLVEHILNSWPRTESDEQYMRYQEGWGWFKNRRHGRKAPTEDLEPGIAFLVKAYNAAGAPTCVSCSGHEPGAAATVHFLGPYAAAWMEFVHRYLGLVRPNWEFGDSAVTIHQADDDSLMRETVEAASTIYARRIFFREMKQRITQEILATGRKPDPIAYRDYLSDILEKEKGGARLGTPRPPYRPRRRRSSHDLSGKLTRHGPDRRAAPLDVGPNEWAADGLATGARRDGP